MKNSLKRVIGGSLANLVDMLQAPVQPSDTQLEKLNAQQKQYAERVPGRKFRPIELPARRSEDLARLLGESREGLRPQGNLEEFAQNFLTQAPFAAATGGLGALGRTALGVGGAQAAKLAGAGHSGQLAAQIAAEGAPGILGGLNKHKKSLYEAAKSLVAGKRGDVGNLKESAIEISDRAARNEVDKAVKKHVKDTIETIQGNVQNKSADIGTLLENRMATHKLYSDIASFDPKSRSLSYLNEATKELNHAFERHGGDFFAHLSEADRIHAAQNMRTLVGDWINEKLYFPKNAFLKKKGGALLRAVPRLVEKAEKAVRKSVNPEINKYFGKIFMAASKNSVPEAIKYTTKLESALDKFAPAHGYQKETLPTKEENINQEPVTINGWIRK